MFFSVIFLKIGSESGSNQGLDIYPDDISIILTFISKEKSWFCFSDPDLDPVFSLRLESVYF